MILYIQYYTFSSSAPQDVINFLFFVYISCYCYVLIFSYTLPFSIIFYDFRPIFIYSFSSTIRNFLFSLAAGTKYSLCGYLLFYFLSLFFLSLFLDGVFSFLMYFLFCKFFFVFFFLASPSISYLSIFSSSFFFTIMIHYLQHNTTFILQRGRISLTFCNLGRDTLRRCLLIPHNLLHLLPYCVLISYN